MLDSRLRLRQCHSSLRALLIVLPLFGAVIAFVLRERIKLQSIRDDLNDAGIYVKRVHAKDGRLVIWANQLLFGDNWPYKASEYPFTG
jgi:hypothetical protein